jgi:hypothetical protein
MNARWNKDYTPDLSIVTRAAENDNTVCTRVILDGFPRSQHRLVLLQYGPRIPLTESVPMPRWNFPRANWGTFVTDIDHVTHFIPAFSSAYNRFSNGIITAAKQHIP